MPSDLRAILGLEVPIIVLIGERQMKTSEVVSLVPGAIIEFPKNSEAELALQVNNKPIGTGMAVKVGENFGLRINFIGDLRSRIDALGARPATATTPSAVSLIGGEADAAPSAPDAVPAPNLAAAA
jgi:flagellar motor switch protein FliN/FliY